MTIKMNIKKGDNVMVIAGKDKGKSGVVAKAFPGSREVVISGVNVKKVHQKPRKKREKGQIIEVAYPIDVSNVTLQAKTEAKEKKKISKK